MDPESPNYTEIRRCNNALTSGGALLWIDRQQRANANLASSVVVVNSADAGGACMNLALELRVIEKETIFSVVNDNKE